MSIFLLCLPTLFQLVLGAKFCSTGQFCVISTFSENKEVCFTVHSGSAGWASIGVGTSIMTDSDMYIGWKNSSNGISVFNVKGVSGYGIPKAMPTQANIVSTPPLLDPKPAWSKLSFSFCRSAKATPEITPTTPYIYGAAAKGPSGNPDTASAAYGIHDGTSYGTMSTNFLSATASTVGGGSTGAIVPLPANLTFKMVCEIHGALMWVAWTLCPIVGICIARYGKDIMGHHWFRVHMILMGGITFLFSIPGFIIIVLYRNPVHFVGKTGMYEDVHVKAGLAVFIGVFFQVASGHLSDRLWTPGRTYVPLLDKVHWWLGRILTILGIIVCYYGFVIYQSKFQVMSDTYLVLFWVFVVCGILMCAIGEWKIGQIHHLAVPEGDEKKA